MSQKLYHLTVGYDLENLEDNVCSWMRLGYTPIGSPIKIRHGWLWSSYLAQAMISNTETTKKGGES